MQLFIMLSAASLFIMIVVDILLGSKAEFLNAFSVIQRLLGQTPSAEASLVARKLGAVGEFIVVMFSNLAIGGILTGVIQFIRTHG